MNNSSSVRHWGTELIFIHKTNRNKLSVPETRVRAGRFFKMLRQAQITKSVITDRPATRCEATKLSSLLSINRLDPYKTDTSVKRTSKFDSLSRRKSSVDLLGRVNSNSP